MIYLSLFYKPNILSPVGETCYSLLEKIITFFLICLVDIHPQCVCVCVCLCVLCVCTYVFVLSHVQLFVTP